MSKRQLAALATLLIAATIPAYAKDDLPAPGDAYFVIGIAPAFTKVKVADGHLDGEKFKESFSVRMWSGNAYWGTPVDGFILIKAHGAEPIFAITQIQFHGSEGSIGWTLYSPCEGAGPNGFMEAALSARGEASGGAMVFTPAPGKVSYIGSVNFVKDEKTQSVAPSYNNDLEGARAFLEAHHPELADGLEPGSYQLRTAEGTCR